MDPLSTFDPKSQGFLLTIDDNDLAIVNKEGLIVASSNPENIGVFLADVRAKSSNKKSLDKSGRTVSNLSSKQHSERQITEKSTFGLKPKDPHNSSTDLFVHKLVSNDHPDNDFFEELRAEAEILGYDLEAKRSAIIIELKGFFEKCLNDPNIRYLDKEKIISNWKQRIKTALEGFFTQNNDMIIAYIGKDRFVIFKSLGNSTNSKFVELVKRAHRSIFGHLRDFTIRESWVGFGNSYTGIRGLYEAYSEADISLKLSTAISPDHKCTYFGDLGLLYILADGNLNKKLGFSKRILEKIDNKIMLETLEAFFQNNLNITMASEKLNVHRNTIIYRLDRITEMIGLDPRNFLDSMAIKIAMILRKISAQNEKIAQAR